MISNKSLNREWIDEIKGKTTSDPILIEKNILALMLSEHLHNTGIEFTLKGGTSLSLILDRLRRFSIDVDIIVKKDQEIDQFFKGVIQQGVFHRFEEDQRSSNVPKCHYKFFYHSVIENTEKSILLDILFEDTYYPVVKMVSIKSDLLLIEGEVNQIKCPTTECLLGDKLTAFAPHTTGILYGIDKDLEIIKQLYDIGLLFNYISDINFVIETFNNVAKKELAYRSLSSLSPTSVLDDIFNTTYLIGIGRFQQNNLGIELQKEYVELFSGIRKLSGFIFEERFTHDAAILCASKAAYLATLIRDERQGISRFDPKLDLSNLEIRDHNYNKLNIVKKISPEAFYYFYKSFGNV